MGYVFFIYLCPRLEREIDNQNRFNRDYSHLKCYILVWRLRKINYQKVIEKMKKLFLVAAFAMVSAFASAQFAVGVHTLYGTDVLMVTLTTTSKLMAWSFGILMPTCTISLTSPTDSRLIHSVVWDM